MSIKNYSDLVVWQKSIQLVKMIYVRTNAFPREEIYGLTSQIRRAAVSIPSNITEGQARQSTHGFKRFLSISMGSPVEVETQRIIAQKLKYVTEELLNKALILSDEIKRMTYVLSSKLILPT